MASHIQRLFLRIGRSPSPLNTYLALVAVAGLLVGAWVLRDAAAAFAGVDLTFWLLTACALPAELARFTVWRPDGQAQVTITMARPFALALVIMRGAPLAVPVFVIASVVSDLIHRKPAVRILFNASQYVLSLAAASATYTALGGQGWVTVEKIPAFVAAAVVMLVVNFLLVRLVVALHQRLPVTIRYLFGSSTVSEFVEGGVWIALLLVAFLVSKRQLTLMLPVLLALAALPLVVAGRMAERVSALVAARSRGRAGEVAALQRRGDAVLRIAELERVRLAADLHDGPVQHNQQQLERIRTVRASIKAGNPVAARVLDQLEQEVMTQTQNLRVLVAELRPPVLQRHGLAGALTHMAREFEASYPIRSTVDAHGIKGLPEELEVVLYRVAQEALTNVVKHAHATLVRVSVAIDGGVARLQVRDDGIGFNPDLVPEDGHYGLALMRERVGAAGGVFHVDSRLGHGATITAEIQVP